VQETARSVAEADLESHCLALLLQRPALLAQVNQALAESQLEPLSGQDFQDPASRAIFEVWEALLENGHPTAIEELESQLPADLQERLEQMLTPDAAHLADEQLLRDAIRTLLRMRERTLKRWGQELRFLTVEAQEAGDIRAEQYVDALRSYQAMLLRTQQALAQRWGIMKP